MRLPHKLPFTLVIRSGDSPPFQSSGFSYNYAIAGLPFLSAASYENPIIRETAPYRKEQFDSQMDVGEQSMQGYWLRSQMSFHGGAGQLYNDPTDDALMPKIRFYSSFNVNVWTPGEVKLLHFAIPNTGLTGSVDAIPIITADGISAAVVANADTLYTFDVEFNSATDSWTESAADITSMTTDGTTIYVATLDGIYSAPIPTGLGGYVWTKIWDITTADHVQIGWVKQRLMAGVDGDVYELVGTGPALPAAKYTTTVPDFRWTAITETSSAIFFCGSGGSVSTIIRFILDVAGEVPTLTSGTVAVQLPEGETANTVYGYLGTFLAIGTNKGIRVGVVDGSGNVTYGPLLNSMETNVTDISGRNTYLWYTVDGRAFVDAERNGGLYRLDLSLPIDGQLRMAHASDLPLEDTDAGPATYVTHLGGSDLILFTSPEAIYVEAAGFYPTVGWLQTSRIRYSTIEPKLFRLMRIRGPLLLGSLGVAAVDQNGSETVAYNFPEGTTPGASDIQLGTPPGLQDFVSLKFYLHSNVDEDQTAVLNAWQIKALPGTPRQRIFTLPLLCFDVEKDKFGQRVGGNRTAYGRLRSLEAKDDAGDLISFQDLDTAESWQVVIESMQFVQTTPPPHISGWGGIITIRLRTT